MTAPDPCPLCKQPLYGWIVLPAPGTEASVGLPLAEDTPGARVVDRCESCGVAVVRGGPVDLAAEWAAVRDGGDGEPIAVPNRASLSAAIGVQGWAAIELSPGRLILTPAGLGLLAEANGARPPRPQRSLRGRGQVWMWQTLLNGLTFHPNFAREVLAGRLRPASARSRPAFAIDAVVSLLGAPLVALLSVPLELIASLLGRGGELRARPPG